MIKNLKPIILLLIFLINMYTVSAEAIVSGNNNHADVLMALKIIDSRPNEKATMTRGDFVNSVIHMMFDEISFKNETLPFSDIEQNKNKDAIVAAANMGIINGNGNGKFEPNSVITLGEALKITVAALGYKTVASFQGGYPLGYLSVASEKGLLRNVSSELNRELRKVEAVEILYNTINADAAKFNAYDGKTAELSIKSGETLLSLYRHIYKINGIVTQNQYTSLTGDSGISKGEIALGETAYLAENADQYIGMYVDAYVYIPQDNSDDSKIVYISPNPSKTKTLDINGDDISDVPDRIDAVSYKDSNEKVITEKLSPIVKIIYNGKARPDCPADEIKNITGSLTLIDNDHDGVYDVLNVKSYETIVVSHVSLAAKKVHNKYSYLGAAEAVDFDIDPNDGDYSLTYKNKRVNLEDLSEWDVLAVLRSKSGTKKLIIAEVIKDTVEGDVDELSVSDDLFDSKVLLDGKSYKLSQEYMKALSAKDDEAIALNIGKTRWVCLDKFGKICAVYDNTVMSNKYGYMLNIKSTGAIAENTQAEILTESGEWIIFSFNMKIKFNGDRVKSQSVASTLSPDGTTIPQLITYKTGADGKIIEFNTANLSNTFNKDSFTKTATMIRQYRVQNMSFDSDVYVSPTTLFFVIPDSGSREKDDYSVSDIGAVDYDKVCNFTAYDLDEYRFTPAIVLKVSPSERMKVSGKMLVVDKVTTSLLDDVVSKKLYGSMANYTNVSAFGKENNTFDGLKKGDIVNFFVSKTGKIENIVPIYSVSEGKKEMNPSSLHVGRTYIAGTVYKTDPIGGRIILNMENAGIKRTLRLATDLPFLLYDNKNEKAEQLNLQEVEVDDYIIFRVEDSNVREGVVIRF